ncbi:hypothetical protein GCM10011613_13250 [Cellvibrio zantedeschiae]|uniref:DUF58 domain-containing protein n=1 Tax=Cellvibrio zantedeschiae TaxID=1237077 RepID=A0ABQ3B0I7_9GAMM|nr:DUF58 domain-containing protein [Cellvibrio zantedeschiae]GGY70188.1 hypothetical protein GCM10011613_13250 [Cellvibrio zantedeschiae]
MNMQQTGLKISEQLAHLNPKGTYVELSNLLRVRFAAQDLRLFVPRAVKSQLNGAERTRFRGRGMDFEEVRLYQAGDDVRSIDWRVTARTQVPHTKLYREERERPVYVLVDQRAPMFFGSQRCFKSVLAAHIGANIAWAALSNSDRIGGLVFGDNNQRDIRPRRSKHAVLEFLHQLQEFNRQLNSPIAPTITKHLEAMFGDARRMAKPGCALFIVSDFHDYNQACEQQLFELARHTDVTLIHVFDPLEKKLQSNSRLSVSDGFNRLQLPTDDSSFQQAYQNAYTHHLDFLTHSTKRLGIPLLSYATTDNLQLLLRERFAAKK